MVVMSYVILTYPPDKITPQSIHNTSSTAKTPHNSIPSELCGGYYHVIISNGTHEWHSLMPRTCNV